MHNQFDEETSILVAYFLEHLAKAYFIKKIDLN